MIFAVLTAGEKQKRNNTMPELEQISEEYYMLIYKYCNMHLETERAYSYDITNEIFMALCEKWSGLRKENVRAWLYRAADNRIKAFLRKHREQIKKEEYIEDLVDYTADDFTYEQNFETVSDENIETYKGEILAELSDKEKALYDMVFVRKLTYKEICEQLCISSDSLKSRVYRLRQKITEAVYIKTNK